MTAVPSKPPLMKSNSQKYDYAEAVHSASSLSTVSDEPFASDSLGATAIRLDKAMAKTKGKVVLGGDGKASPLGLEPLMVSPGPLKTYNKLVSEISQLDILCLCTCLCMCMCV